MTELTWRQRNQSKKAEIVNYYYQWQILKPSGKREAKGISQFLHTERGESYFERYCSNRSSPWFHEIKISRCDFVSINCMRAGYSNLQANLSRFNIVSMAECEYGDRLQMEGHVFWDCKLYEDQRATMMDILSENSKKEYPKSVTELLRLEEKRFVQGVCYYINKIPNLFKEKEVNVQYIYIYT
jgi:hypothetical protein